MLVGYSVFLCSQAANGAQCHVIGQVTLQSEFLVHPNQRKTLNSINTTVATTTTTSTITTINGRSEVWRYALIMRPPFAVSLE